MVEKNERRVYELFAEILDYPGDNLLNAVNDGVRWLSGVDPAAAEDLRAFGAIVESESLSRMEETYTRTFDITPITTLYAGYHLFGESYKRGAFLVRLQEEFRRHGFSAGIELPDHLCVLLRFVSVVDDPEFVNPLLAECLDPALEKMEKAFESGKNGYARAISSLSSFLRHECQWGAGAQPLTGF